MDRAKDIVEYLLLILMVASPFIIGALLYLWLTPETFWQKLIFGFIATIVCGIEGIWAWKLVLGK